MIARDLIEVILRPLLRERPAGVAIVVSVIDHRVLRSCVVLSVKSKRAMSRQSNQGIELFGVGILAEAVLPLAVWPRGRAALIAR